MKIIGKIREEDMLLEGNGCFLQRNAPDWCIINFINHIYYYICLYQTITIFAHVKKGFHFSLG